MRKFWLQTEEDKLVAMLAAGKSNEQIALALGRSVHAVHNKRSRMGLTDDKLRCGAEVRPAPEAAQPSELKQQTLVELNAALKTTITGLEAIKDELKSQRVTMGDLEAAVTTAMEVTADAIDLAADQKVRITYLRDDVNDIDDYLAHGRVWRLFHSYAAYRRMLYADRKKGGKA